MARKHDIPKGLDARGGTKWAVFAEHWLFACILACGLILRAWQIGWGLPHLYEEAIPFHDALKFWDLEKSPIDEFFFVYPALTYYLQFAAQAVVFGVGMLSGQFHDAAAFLKAAEADPSTLVLAGRAITVLFDAGTITAAYVLVRRVAEKRAALCAAALLATNALMISQAHLINVDTPLTFFSVLLLLWLLAIYERPARKWYLLAGLTVGMAAATKYNAAILVAAVVAAHLLRASTVADALRSLRDRSLIAAVILSGAVFLLINPLILTHVSEFLTKFRSTELHMEAGHLGLDANQSTLGFYILESLPSNVGWILTAAAMASVAVLGLAREKKLYLLLVIPVLYILLLASWQMRADRYILPVVPFLLIIASVALFRVWDALLARSRTAGESGILRSAGLRRAGAIVLTAVLGYSSLGSSVRYLRSLGLPDTRTVAQEWIEKNMPLGSAIAAGPFGIELADTRFLKLPIQFSAVNSEQMAPFYDTRWYEDLDLVVASDFDYGRYLQDPGRYRDMLGFYDSLRTRWTLSSSYAPGEGHTGPTIWLYVHPVGSTTDAFDPALLARLDAPGINRERKVNFLGKLGLILMVKNRPVKSEQCFRKLLEIDPGNQEAAKALGRVTALLGDRTVVRPGGADAGAVRRMEEDAAHLLEAGKIAESEQAFLAILEKDPQSHAAYQGLMLVYAYQDDQPKVVALLTRYLKILPPGSDEYRLVKEQIDQLK